MKGKIDNGRPFDWGSASADYAKYRDIYPREFLNKLLPLCKAGESVLDIGTGTGVIPRLLYESGAVFTGVDASENQIAEAGALSAGKNIEYLCCKGEDIPFAARSFDNVIACQCFWYFDHERLCKRLFEVLRDEGRFAVGIMNWLPFEDETARETEKLVLKFNPEWTGKDFDRQRTKIPECYNEYFSIESEEAFDIDVLFTRETWNGRIKACRGVGAALSEEKVREFEKEHLEMLCEKAPESFCIKHFGEIIILKRGKI